MSYHYELEPMFGEIAVELEYDVYYDYCPGDRDTPPACDCYVEYILHKGKEVSEEALVRLFSAHYGRHMSYEDIGAILIKDWESWLELERDDDGEDAAFWKDYWDSQRGGM